MTLVAAGTATLLYSGSLSKPISKPKSVYEAKIENNEKSDLVIRLENGENEVMLRGENSRLTHLKDKKQKELDVLKNEYDYKRQQKISEYRDLRDRLAIPEDDER